MNATRAGIARLRGTPYAPAPTMYDGLFPNGTLLTAPTRPKSEPPAKPPDADGR